MFGRWKKIAKEQLEINKINEIEITALRSELDSLLRLTEDEPIFSAALDLKIEYYKTHSKEPSKVLIHWCYHSRLIGAYRVKINPQKTKIITLLDIPVEFNDKFELKMV